MKEKEASLGLPTRGVFFGSVQSSSGAKQAALFDTSGAVLLKVGDPAPGISGATIGALRNPSGQAVVATLRGPLVKPANDTVLYAGLGDGSVRVALREGDVIAGGATLKKLLAIDGNGATIFFRATLGGSALKSNDVALGAVLPDATVQLLAREGDLVGGKPITVVGTLLAVRGTLAEGRWRVGPAAIGVRLSFAGKSQALYSIPTTATSPDGWTFWRKTGDQFANQEEVRSFGLPGFAPDGVSYAAQLVRGRPITISSSNDVVLVRETTQGVALIASKGGSVPDPEGALLPGLTFAKFIDPIAGATNGTAFAATIAGPGVNATNRSGLWFAASDGTLRMVARAGELAPGGGRWSSFQSLALPDGPQSGPLFTGDTL